VSNSANRPMLRFVPGWIGLVAALAVGVGVLGGGSTAVANRPTATGASMALSVVGALNAVSAVSTDDVWAIGWRLSSGESQPLIVHWDGNSWKPVATPSSGRQPFLEGVAASSSTSAWIVGSTNVGLVTHTMILHWDGGSWSRVPSTSPGSSSQLFGVTTVSDTDAWAVGDTFSRTGDQTLILHWDGKVWNRVRSPSPGGDAILSAVAAVSPDNVWAVGNYAFRRGNGFIGRSLILHWNGTSWTRMRSPNPRIPGGGGRDDLGGVDATAAGDVWTVGVSGGDCGCGFAPGYVEHWNGHAWARVRVPNLRAGVSVTGVAMAWTGQVWITGTEGLGRGPWRTLLLSCRGSNCHRMRTPSPGASGFLDQITAVSPSDAWAVGGWSRTTYGRTRTLILHWNGRKWS
jgi:hypothetical protein